MSNWWKVVWNANDVDNVVKCHFELEAKISLVSIELFCYEWMYISRLSKLAKMYMELVGGTCL